MNKPIASEPMIRPVAYVRPQVERLGSWKQLTETPMGSVRPLKAGQR